MTKKILSLCVAIICFAFFTNAQLPNKFNFQGIVRNASGVAVSNQAVQIRISILDASSTGPVVYQEKHSVTTNQFGLYNVAIGAGTVLSGTFVSINWGFQDKYIKTELSTNNGVAFSTLGTSQLLAVPYAMYAGSTNTPGPAGPQGPQGPTGSTGPQGPAGPQGIAGSNGNTILSGTTAPTSAQGNNGDYYLNTTTNILYGPKTTSGWGSGTILTGQGPQGPQGPAGPTGPQGPAGPTGATGLQGIAGATGATGPQGPQGIAGAAGPQGPSGTNGNTILNGTTVPTSAIGNNGDFYINTTTNIIYGPKTIAGWGTGTTLSGGSSGGSLSNTNFQVFDASGTFTVPAGITKIMVECWGAGGGTGPISGFAKGGDGGYGKSIFTVTPGSTYPVSIGLGALGGGGASSFGTNMIVSNGGDYAINSNCIINGGTSTGTISMTGQYGMYIYSGNAGLSSPWCTQGGNAPGRGAQTGSSTSATAGANGRVIVWW
jgi:hypothetical protein